MTASAAVFACALETFSAAATALIANGTSSMPSAAAGAVLEMNLLAQDRMETPRVVLIAARANARQMRLQYDQNFRQKFHRPRIDDSPLTRSRSHRGTRSINHGTRARRGWNSRAQRDRALGTQR